MRVTSAVVLEDIATKKKAQRLNAGPLSRAPLCDQQSTQAA
jgi:hypothetical protein